MGGGITNVSGIFHGPSKDSEAPKAGSNQRADLEQLVRRGTNTQLFHTGDDTHRSFGGWIWWSGTLKMVQWVEVTKITFQDGSEWIPSPSSHCSLVPLEVVEHRKRH
jgi:hypothetical protein